MASAVAVASAEEDVSVDEGVACSEEDALVDVAVAFSVAWIASLLSLIHI